MSGRRERPRSVRPVYHLGLSEGELPSTVLLPGDPDRAEEIARSWEEHTPLHARREYQSYRGVYRGAELGVVSAGIGGPSISIAVEELARVGVQTFVRVGTCGAVDPRVRAGDLVLSTAAARFEATSRAYAPPGYPAVADPEVLNALTDAARDAGVRFHRGITATVETFYLDQGRPGFRGYLPPWVERSSARLRSLGILNVEMECATLFTIAAVYGLRAGAVCTALGDPSQEQPTPQPMGPAIHVANEAARRLAGPSAPRPQRPPTGRTAPAGAPRRRPRAGPIDS